MRRAALSLLALTALVAGVWRGEAAPSRAAVTVPGVRIWVQPGVPAGAAQATAARFGRLVSVIDADFPPHGHPVITLRFYATHAGFAAALHRLEGVWPQRQGDNVGNIVGTVLPLGPDSGLLTHNLAHVYTE